MKPKKFFKELKRRKVYRVALVYPVVAWVLVQITTQTLPFFDVPNWAVRLVILLLAIGYPVALVLAWAYELTPEGLKLTDEIDPKTPPSARVLQAADIPEKSIAVLPFENLSDDQENAYFADGIQDDILSNLSKIADLKVISRTSVRQYKGGTRNLREIGEALGVAHILEGTVRRSGQRIRINAQLINARTDAHIWADTFDRELIDLFAVQSELAERITVELRANLSPREKASLHIHSTADLDAYENFLRARDLFRWAGAGDPAENGKKALHFLDQAIARDPKFALAHCLASRWHAELYWFGHDRSSARLANAKGAADRALHLRPDLAEAHLALAYYHYFGFREYENARAELEIARHAAPNDAEIFEALGSISRRQGRWDDAITNWEKAHQLDPRNVSVIWNLVETRTALHRYSEAEVAIQGGLAVKPDAHLFSLARATIDLRRNGDIGSFRETLRKIPPEFDPGGGVSLLAMRVSLMERDYAQATHLLAASRYERFNDTGLGGVASMLDGYSFPRAWYEGLIARGRGNVDAARRAFESARQQVEADLPECCIDDAKAIAMLGLVNAALGNKEEAIRLGSRAVELLPISKDAYDGPVFAANLAVIYAQLGEQGLALEQLAQVLALPNGPTPGTLRIEPEWDSLRGDPRFEKMIAGG